MLLTTLSKIIILIKYLYDLLKSKQSRRHVIGHTTDNIILTPILSYLEAFWSLVYWPAVISVQARSVFFPSDGCPTFVAAEK